jgi:hypothetical protein
VAFCTTTPTASALTSAVELNILRPFLPISGQHHQTDPSMQVASEVKDFSGASERLLSTIAMNRQLTEEEAKVIQYYCKELLAKVAPRLHHLE